jgi:hypothetical protein
MENKHYGQIIGSRDAPYENWLARQCGLATNYTAITNPSLPNYIAATSGTLFAHMRELFDPLTHSKSPGQLPRLLPGRSIFGQLRNIGKDWRAYQEGMPKNCHRQDDKKRHYAVRHNPVTYYRDTDEIHDHRTDCRIWDVPLGTAQKGNFANDLKRHALPAFSFVTPSLCNDMHGTPLGRLSGSLVGWLFHLCPGGIRVGDKWLQKWVTTIVRTSEYRNGDIAVFITWDEGHQSKDSSRGDLCEPGSREKRCHVATLVVSRSTPAGTQCSTQFSHYSLLKTTEELLGIDEFLGHARYAKTKSMRACFNLGSQ